MLVFQRHGGPEASDLFRVGTSKAVGPQRAASAACSRRRAGKDFKMLISLMLICAILASLALGVLAAYGVCLGFFQLMAGRAGVPVRATLESARAKAEV